MASVDTSDLYPDQDFLADYDNWEKLVADPRSPWRNQGLQATRVVFSAEYEKHPEAFRYRMNRFVCIQNATFSQLPRLVQDRIALPDGGDGGHIPQDLLLALLAWYRTVPESEMRKMPPPDWPWVLAEFDRLDSKYQ